MKILRICGIAPRICGLDLVGHVLDVADGERRAEGDLHREQDDVGPEVEGQHLRHALDAVDRARELEDARLVLGRRALADEQPVGDPREDERDGAQQDADDDAADRVPEAPAR